MSNRILVAGVGNIFFGDDAFGVEVVRELSKLPQPEGVRITDFGIRSYDLAYALTERYEAVILVDAVPQGKPPGTTCLMELDFCQFDPLHYGAVDAHGMDLGHVLQMSRSIGQAPEKIFLVGCEPAVLDREDGAIGLSAEVSAAVPTAISMIHELVTKTLENRPVTERPGANDKRSLYA